MLSVVICQALVLVLPLGNIVLLVVICQALVLVLPLGNIVLGLIYNYLQHYVTYR
jgi:hypothetical protein